jgi:hypothetical protein
MSAAAAAERAGAAAAAYGASPEDVAHYRSAAAEDAFPVAAVAGMTVFNLAGAPVPLSSLYPPAGGADTAVLVFGRNLL